MDLTIEESSRLKVIYGSAEGFHAVDLDSASVYDIYLPKHVSATNDNNNNVYTLWCIANSDFHPSLSCYRLRVL